MPKKRVLFICTGNYYRSRFAEGLFNWEARSYGLNWCAFSRGLALDQLAAAAGPISYHTQTALALRNIPLSMTARVPRLLTERDLGCADLSIAIDQAEHRPYMRRRFPLWEDKIRYWQVGDIQLTDPQEALPRIACHINALLCELAGGPLQRH